MDKLVFLQFRLK